MAKAQLETKTFYKVIYTQAYLRHATIDHLPELPVAHADPVQDKATKLTYIRSDTDLMH